MPSFDTPDPITVGFDVSVGNAHITAADRGTTVVDVHPTDPTSDADVKAAEATRVEFDQGQLTVRSSRLRSLLDRTGASVDVTIQVPTGSSLHGTVGMGDIRAAGRFGECRLKTGLGRIQLDEAATLHLKSGAGDVAVDRVTGHADVVAAAGDVAVRELGSTGAIRNSNGATWVGTATGEVRLHAANGDIALELAHAGVVAKSANGDVRLEEVVRGSVVLETQIGDLEVGIRPGTAAWLDLSSRAGAVHNTLDSVDAPDATTATVEVRGRTSIGEILVRRPRGATDAA